MSIIYIFDIYGDSTLRNYSFARFLISLRTRPLVLKTEMPGELTSITVWMKEAIGWSAERKACRRCTNRGRERSYIQGVIE